MKRHKDNVKTGNRLWRCELDLTGLESGKMVSSCISGAGALGSKINQLFQIVVHSCLQYTEWKLDIKIN
jgi:hypothetical protein